MAGIGAPVVVGTDGSAGAVTAVRWAAAEAYRREAELVILHAYDARWIADQHLPAPGFVDIAQARAAEIVADAELAARSVSPDIKVRRETDAGQPVPALLHAAVHASLVVVGSRGHGGFTSLLLGSVGQSVATHAACSVVVVPDRFGSPTGPIVVGVDGSSDGTLALEAAFRQALAEGCPIEAVRAFLRPAPPWVPDIAPSVLWLEEGIAAERAMLTRTIAPFRQKYATVGVVELVNRADAAHSLIEASRRARLVVVGSRGLGPVAGMLIGSVGLHLLHHAHCPVMIARR